MSEDSLIIQLDARLRELKFFVSRFSPRDKNHFLREEGILMIDKRTPGRMWWKVVSAAELAEIVFPPGRPPSTKKP